MLTCAVPPSILAVTSDAFVIMKLLMLFLVIKLVTTCGVCFKSLASLSLLWQDLFSKLSGSVSIFTESS